MSPRNHLRSVCRSRGILAAVAAGLLLGVPAGWGAVGPAPVELWPDGAPGKVGDESADKPELRIYLPDAANRTGTGIVVCPGGGYGVLATDHEGHQIARWLNQAGVAAFVLKYRLAPRYRHPAPLQDAQRAIRYVRAHAKELGVSPRRIGIMGFSAGGHLASTAATHFDSGRPDADDEIEKQSCRPDFAVLAYPVISLEESYSHRGSARNLLGENADPAKLTELSNEKHVTKETPPVFLFHTGEDAAVAVEHSLSFYQACRRAGVPAELHVYRYGPHGIGLAPGDPAAATWKDRLLDWLRASGLLADVERAAVEGMVRVDGQPLRWGMITFIPADSPHKPTAFAMVSRGAFRIPAASGPPIGKCLIELRDLGSVEAQPTIEDVQRLDRNELTYVVNENGNNLTIEVKRK